MIPRTVAESAENFLARVEARVLELERGGTADAADLAAAYVRKGNALARAGRTGEALSVYDDVVTRYAAADSSHLFQRVAWALHAKALLLRSLGEYDAALGVVRDLRARLDERGASQLLREHFNARILEALIFVNQGFLEQGLAQLEAVIAEVGKSPPADLLFLLAHALAAQSQALTDLGRYREALIVCDEVRQRFGTSQHPKVREQLAQVLVTKGDCLAATGNEPAAVTAFSEALAESSADDSRIFRGVRINALLERARTRLLLGQKEEALVDIEQLTAAELWDAASPEQRIRALAHKAVAYINLGQPDKARPFVEEILSLREREEAASTKDAFAAALYYKGLILERSGRAREARAAYAEVIQRYGEVDHPEVREVVRAVGDRLRALA